MAITLDGTNGVTTPDLTVDTDTLTVDATNNRVGIGTSSPSTSKLTVKSDAASDTPNIRIETFRPNIRFADLSTSAVDAEIKMDGNALRFNLSAEVDNDTALTERMRIDSDGDVYIGETTGGSGLTSVVRAKGFNCRTGHTGSLGGNIFNINWTGSAAQLWIDTTNLGTFISSDYRIKRNIETQTEPALNRIAQLRPVTYQPADYGTAFVASDEIKEGFIAHELAEVVPSAVEGEKDAEDQIQSLKLDALCSVMVKAIQEQQEEINQLKARIEALEAGNGS